MIDIGIGIGNSAKEIFDMLKFIFKYNPEIKIRIQNENSKNMRYNLLIFNDKINYNIRGLLKLLKDEDVVLLNTDENSNFENFRVSRGTLISYGVNNKASMTMSSLTKDLMQFCMQRSIVTLKKNLVCEQEFSVALKNIDQKTDKVIAVISASLIVGLNSEQIRNKFNVLNDSK